MCACMCLFGCMCVCAFACVLIVVGIGTCLDFTRFNKIANHATPHIAADKEAFDLSRVNV